MSRAYTREITSSDTVNNSEDHTLYARWTAGEYTVSFNSNGGSAVSPIGVTYGKKYGNLPLPTKPGYTFDGWYTDKELTKKFDFDKAVRKSDRGLDG